MSINKEHWLHSLSVINRSGKLRDTFKEQTKLDFSFPLLTQSFENGYLRDDIVNAVENIGAICFEINGKLFLRGETKGEHDLVGDKMYFQSMTELFDMTTEMETGDSYSFYVSSIDYFKLAEVEDCIKVNEFLKSMR